MKTLSQLVQQVAGEKSLQSGKIPDIDLYMDQILTLMGEKEITKTMINNYSKEHLIKPLKGKKYSKEQIIQILCIMNLKQTLALNSIRALMPQQEGTVDFQKVYDICVAEEERLTEAMARFAAEELSLPEGLTEEEEALASAMMLSCGCIYLRRLCEALAAEPERE